MVKGKVIYLSAGLVAASFVCLWFLQSLLLQQNGFISNSSSSSSSSRVLQSIYREKEDEMEEHEHETEEEKVESMVVLIIVLILILLTIAFEIIKENIEEHANRNFKPIIEKLFGELTVLGFLSIFTFVVTQAGYFEIISMRIYDGDRNELLEMFELVHYSIFFIMIFFVIQVLILVGEAMEMEENWLQMDRECRSLPIDWATNVLEQKKKRSVFMTAIQLFPFFRQVKQESKEDLVLFKAVRDEFILDRSVEPPFQPQPVENRLSTEFNFGRYLAVCLSSTLQHTVEVSIGTWACFAFGTIIFAFIHYIFNFNYEILVFIWIGCGWAFFLFELFFELHLLLLRDKFASQIAGEPVEADEFYNENGNTKEEVPTDTTPLTTTNNNNHNLLPGWTKVDLDTFHKRRSWIFRFFVGGTPNRQQALYWADRKGPKFYLFILQVKLIFMGIYTSVHVLEFMNHMWTDHSTITFIVYAIISLLPVLGVIFNSKHLVATLSLVCCLGTYRRHQVITAVLHENKAAAAVRSFICIYKLRKFASYVGEIQLNHSSNEDDQNGDRLHYSKSFTELEQKEVGKTFDAFDLSGDGTISADEIEQLMLSLGAPIMPSTIQLILRRLDTDGSGEISREEFIQWYKETMIDEDDHVTDHDRATFLFSLFDHNNSGEITIGEFKHKLDSINAGFTVDEIGYIVNELDRDNNGSVSLEEFEQLLHRFYPRELRSNMDTSLRGSRSLRSSKR